MNVRDLVRLYDYDSWANRKLFLVIAQLTPEQFTQTVAGSYESVRNTLVHMMSAKWGWLARCGGRERGPALKAADFPTFESVKETWTAVDQYMQEFLLGVTEEDVNRTIEYISPVSGEKQAMKLCALLQHAANHSSHHRGQVSLLLRMLGHAPGNVDMVLYDAEQVGSR